MIFVVNRKTGVCNLGVLSEFGLPINSNLFKIIFEEISHELQSENSNLHIPE